MVHLIDIIGGCDMVLENVKSSPLHNRDLYVILGIGATLLILLMRSVH